MMKFEKNPYCVLKTKPGETIFAEVKTVNANIVVLASPFLIRTQSTDHGDSLYATPWCPYSNQDSVAIMTDVIYYMDCLNEKFVEFYGSVILQQKISDIKHEVADKMEDGNDYYAMMEGVEKIKQVSEEISSKFGIENLVDTTSFEEQAQKHKPVLN